MLDTILEVRTAGVTAEEIRRAATRGSPAHDLPAVLTEYERLLEAGHLADPAEVFRAAIDAFEREAPFVLGGVIAVVPARAPRGLPGRFQEMLIAHGAEVLRVDEVDAERVVEAGVAADFFGAATPSDELREVFRRVVAEQLRWDDVEIVATDPDTYGIALDALCQQLGVGATILSGIPLSRTRVERLLGP